MKRNKTSPLSRSLAVALKYGDDDQEAPVIVAAGRGEIAEKIVAAAQQGKVPLYQDEAMAEILSSLKLGTEIPPQLYEAVAQIIAFVWQIDQKYAGGMGKSYENKSINLTSTKTNQLPV